MTDPTLSRLHHLADTEPAALADLLRLLRRRGDQAAIHTLVSRLCAQPNNNPYLLAQMLLDISEPAEWGIHSTAYTNRPLRAITTLDHLSPTPSTPRTLYIAGLSLPLLWGRARAAHYVLDCARASQHLLSTLCELPPHQHLPLPTCDLILASPSLSLSRLIDSPTLTQTANALLHEALDVSLAHITDALYKDPPPRPRHRPPLRLHARPAHRPAPATRRPHHHLLPRRSRR